MNIQTAISTKITFIEGQNLHQVFRVLVINLCI